MVNLESVLTSSPLASVVDFPNGYYILVDCVSFELSSDVSFGNSRDGSLH